MGLSTALLTASAVVLYQARPTAAQGPQHTDLTLSFDCEDAHISCGGSVGSFAVSEPETGTTFVPMSISASPPLLAPVVVRVAVELKDTNGSGVNPAFVSVTVDGVAIDNDGGLEIASGAQNTGFELALTADAIAERDSVFTVTFLPLLLRDVMSQDGLLLPYFRSRQNGNVPDTISPGVFEESAPVVFTVRQSDQPFGTVAMQASSSRSFAEPELVEGLTETDVIASITRVNCPGTVCGGSVEVTLELYFDGGYDSANASDVVLAQPTVTCVNSEPCSVRVRVLADDEAEIAEAFSLRIVDTHLVGFRGTVPFDETAALTFTILPNDNPEGFVAFELADVRVSEPGTALVNVIRTGSCFGSVTAFYSIVYGSADPSDLVDGDSGGTVSGSLMFPDEPGCAGGQLMPINIAIQDDETVEASESFEVVLIAADLTVGGLIRSRVTIGPNDLAGGIFSLRPPPITEYHERDNISFTIQRATGFYGAATVTWVAAYFADGVDQPWKTGTVDFAGDQRTGTLHVMGDDDEIPEVDTTYQFRIVNVESALGSGLAVRDPAMFEQAIVVSASDFPYGRYAAVASAATTYEEGNTAQFGVHRSDGLVGDVTVRWTVDDAHADDVIPNTGTVTFQAFGARDELIVVTIAADTIPEFAETIAVSISMVSGNVDSTVIDVSTLAADAVPITFIIEANDYAYGLFQFSQSDVDGVEGNNYTLSINRIGGDSELVGSASVAVTWQWVGTPPPADQVALDFHSSSTAPNTVVFPSGRGNQPVTVSILPDTLPEMGARYTAELTGVSIILENSTVVASVTGMAGIGSIDDADFNKRLTVSEQASGSPYGVFEVTGAGLSGTPYVEGETVAFSISRGRLNDFGTIRVAWSVAMSGGATDSTAPSVSQSAGSVVFNAGQTVSDVIEITILDDSIPSLRTSYDITINVIGGRQDLIVGPGTFTYVEADGVTANAFAVLPDDNVGGTFWFASSLGAACTYCEARLSEPVTGSATYVIDSIVRLGDFRGEATVTLLLSPTTNAVLAATSITFRDGERTKNVTVTVYGDGRDKVAQPFDIDFQDVSVGVDPQAGVERWQDAQRISAVIAYSGHPFGTVAFQAGGTTRSVIEGEIINLVISRPTDTTVPWNESFAVDIVGGEADLEILEQATFADSNVESATFRARLVSNDGAEPPETVVLAIAAIRTNAVGIYAIGPASEITLNIAGNGNYRGLFSFAEASRGSDLYVAEDQVLVLDVDRDEGSTGAVDIPWRIVFGSGQAGDVLSDERFLASEDDFGGVVSGIVSFTDGQTAQSISITPRADGIAELPEGFVVGLGSLAGQPNAVINRGASETGIIAIASSGSPQGTVVLSASTQSLAEGGSIPVTVTRSGELNLQARVKITATPVGPEPEWADISFDGAGTPTFDELTGVATFILAFADGVGGSQTVTLSMVDDDEPEVASQVNITIESVRGQFAESIIRGQSRSIPNHGAVVTGPPVTVAVPESDAPAGVIGFRNAGTALFVSESDTDATILHLVRGPGTEGSVSVDWAVGGGPGRAADLVTASGSVMFADGMDSGVIELRVADDSHPELEETLVVELSNPTGGATISSGSGSTARIMIEENDAPYGRFALSSAAIAQGVETSSQRVMSIAIQRMAGQEGTVDVPVFIGFSANGSECAPAVTAIPPGPHMVRFAPAEAIATIDIAIIDGVRLNTVDVFCVSLGTPDLLDESGSGVETDPPALVAEAAATATVEVPERYANGDITIVASADSVAEGSAITYTVTRSGGQFGRVELNLSIAEPVPDSPGVHGATVQLASGQRSASFAVDAIRDGVPELAMRLNAVASIVVGAQHATLSGFCSTSRRSRRSQECSGAVSACLGSTDTAFDDGCYMAAMDLEIPESILIGAQCVEVNSASDVSTTCAAAVLEFVRSPRCGGGTSEPTPALTPRDIAGALNCSTGHTFTIPANDDPYGSFSLEAAADGSRDVETVKSFGTHNVSLKVVRRQGLRGTVTVRVQTFAAPGNRRGMAIGPAQAQRDFLSFDQILTFDANATIEIPFELTVIGSGPSAENSNFAVRMTVVSSTAGDVHVAQSEVEVHILTCPECKAYFDDPTAVRFLYEAEGVQSVALRRDFQAYGELVVGWIITPETATNAFAMDFTDLGCADTAAYNCTYECGGRVAGNENQCGYYGHAVFAPGEDTTTINLQVIDDEVPELLKNGILRITHIIRGEGNTSDTANSTPLQILPNDFPYGTFSVTADDATYDEPIEDASNDLATFTVVRNDGTLGAIRLEYTTDLADPLVAIFGSPESGTRVEGDDAVLTIVSNDNGDAATRCASLCWQRPECQAFSITPSMDNATESRCYTAPSAASAVLVGEDNLFYAIDHAKSRDYARAGRDFTRQTRTIVFADAQTVAHINITLIPDDIPELAEYLTVRIVSVDFDDGETRVVSFDGLDTSSWMRFVDAAAGPATTQIAANSFPHGIFEFEPQAACTTAPPCLVVDEVPGNAAATYSIDIVRRYGTFGEVTVNWYAASPIPGVSIPPSSITFAEGETRRTMSITVVDDAEPEPEQSVVLYLEQDGQPESRTFITVVVGASDDVFGLFSLLQSSPGTNTTVDEGESIAFVVHRSDGFIHDQVVRWRVTNGASQVEVSEGELTFFGASNEFAGTRMLPFEVTIKEDEDPELSHPVQVTIFLPPSRCPDGRCGRTADASDVTFVVAESDFPYGTFRFDAPSVYVEERDDHVNLTVRRLGGALGQRIVSYKTVEGTASNGEDFSNFSNWTELTFEDGERSQTFTLSVHDDSSSEPSENFQVLLRDDTYASADNAQGTEQVTVTIGPSDDGREYGVFGFELDSGVALEQDEPEVPEVEVPTTTIVLSRGGGTYGSVTVNYVVIAATALERFTSVADGRSAVPESMTRSNVAYTTSEGCARSCFSDDYSFVVAENFLYRPNSDGDNGLGACITLSGRALTADDVIPAVSTATWRFYTVDSAALPHYAIAGQDFIAATGTVTFESADETKTLEIALPMSDTAAEAREIYRVKLTSVEMEGITGNGPELAMTASSFDVTIPANDNFDGTIGVTSSDPVTLPEGATHTVTIRRDNIVNPTTVPIAFNWTILDGDENVATADFVVAQGTGRWDNRRQSAVDVDVVATADVAPELEERFTFVITPVFDFDTDGIVTNSFDVRLGASMIEFIIPSYPISGGSFAVDDGNDGNGATLIEGTSITWNIFRVTAALVDIPVVWSIVAAGANNTAVPTAEFEIATDTIVFPAGISQLPVTITASADEVLDVNQAFEFRIDVTDDRATATNDSPRHGGITIAGNGDTFAISGQVFELLEGGRIAIPVVRRTLLSGDEAGQVFVTWTASGLPARGVGTSGTLVFEALADPNNDTQYINISLPDDDLPELASVVQVRLTNATGGATGVTHAASSRATEVHVAASDDAYGIFALVGPEAPAPFAEGSSADFRVFRTASAPDAGDVNVAIRVTLAAGTFGGDFNFDGATDRGRPESGETAHLLEVVVPGNSSSASFTVHILDTDGDELEEAWSATIEGATLAADDSALAGVLPAVNPPVMFSVALNGLPRGSLSIGRADASACDHENETVQLTVTRTDTQGNLSVSYTIHPSADSVGVVVDELGDTFELSAGLPISSGIPITEEVSSWSVEAAPVAMAPGGKVLVSTSPIGVVISDAETFGHVQRLDVSAISAQLFEIQGHWYLFVAHGGARGCGIYNYNPAGVAIGQPFGLTPVSAFPGVASLGRAAIFDAEVVVVAGGETTTVLEWTDGLGSSSGTPHFVDITATMPLQLPVATAVVAHPTETAIILVTAAGIVHAFQTAQGLQLSPATAAASCPGATSLTPFVNLGHTYVAATGPECSVILKSAGGDDNAHALVELNDMASTGGQNFKLYPVTVEGETVVLSIYELIADDLNTSIDSYRWNYSDGATGFVPFASLSPRPGRSTVVPVTLGSESTGFTVMLMEQDHMNVRTYAPTSSPSTTEPTRGPTYENTAQPSVSPTVYRRCAEIGGICNGPAHEGPTQCIEGTFCGATGDEGNFVCRWHDGFHDECNAERPCNATVGFFCSAGHCASSRLCSAAPTASPTTSTPSMPPTRGPTITDIVTAPPTSSPTETTERMHYCNTISCARQCTGPSGVLQGQNGAQCAWSTDRMRCVDVSYDNFTITTSDELGMCTPTSFAPTAMPTRMPTALARIGYFTVRSLGIQLVPKDVQGPAGPVFFQDGESNAIITIHINSDGVPEGEERFTIELLGGDALVDGAAISPDASVNVTLCQDPATRGVVGFDDASIHRALNTAIYEPEIDASTAGPNVLEVIIRRWGYSRALALTTCRIAWEVTGNAGLADLLVGGRTAGEIAFAEGATVSPLLLELAEDDIPEFDAQFRLTLSETGDGCGVVNSGNRASVNFSVAMSDEPEGAIQFAAPRVDLGSHPGIGEEVSASTSLLRAFDAFSEEAVTVSYTIHPGEYYTEPQRASEFVAVADYFAAVAGDVVFPANSGRDAEQSVPFVLTINRSTAVFGAAIRFRVELQTATPAALISFTQRTFDVYIPATTGAYGGVSLGAAAISADTNPTTPARTLSFEAARVGGDFRNLSVVYEIDYVSGEGDVSTSTAAMLVDGRRSDRLFFGDGVTATNVSVDLATDVRIEAGGSFRITLGTVAVVDCAPTVCPPAAGGVGTTGAQVPAEAANGIIRFDGDASLYTLYEPPASPSSVTLGLIREGGTFGTDVVRFTLAGVVNAAAEVTISETVTFATGDTEAEVEVTVAGDEAPDFDQAVDVTATGNSSLTVLLDGDDVISMVIKGNDSPHGEAGFALDQDTVVFVSNSTHRGLSVALERTGNAAGNATISYSLSSSTGARGFTELPSDSAQFTFTSGDVGVAMVYIALTASTEVPVGTIFTATLAGNRPEVTDAVETSPIEFTGDTTVAESVATPSDLHTYGVISVRTDVSAVREGGEAVVIVERSDSTLMLATEVTIFTQSSTANAAIDFAEVSQTVSFAAGQRTVPVTVDIFDDDTPELDETFSIVASGAVGAVLGSDTVNFNIPPNDGVYGTVSFAPSEIAERDVSEPAGTSSRHVFRVIREPRGMPVSISWSAEGDDCSPSGGLVEFTSQDHILTFMIEIPGDSVPELSKTIALSLSANGDDAVSVTGLTELLLTIPANDAIAVSSLDDGLVGSDRILRYAVSPDGDAPYTVGYTLSWGEIPTGGTAQPCSFPLTASQGRADGSNDGGSCTSTSVVDGRDGMLSIAISSGSYLVEGETFNLVLTSASNGDGEELPFDAASAASHTSVYAADGAISFAEGSLAIAVAEPESGVIAVTLTVLRTGGLFTPGGDGSIELEWVSNARSVTSLTPRGNILSFDNATTMKTINLQLAADSVPEIDERVIITLGQVRYCTLSGDCQLQDDRMVAANTKRSTVVIAASGSPYGIVQFAESHTLVTLANQIISLPVNRTIADSSAAGSYGAVLVHWSAQQLEGDTLPLINIEGDITLADGQSVGVVELDLISAGFWDSSYDYKTFTVTLTIASDEGELGGQTATSVAVVGDGAIDSSASNAATCAIYQNAACLGVADAAATAHSRCLASLVRVDVASICASQLQRLIDDAEAVATWASARAYPPGAGAETYHTLLDSWLSIPIIAPLATGLVGKFAVSLLGECGTGSTGGCGCERSSTVAGSAVTVYAFRRNPAAIMETPTFPTAQASAPSITLPADDLLDLAGAQRLNAANCLSYYYVENTASDLEMPATTGHVLSGSLAITVGIDGLAAPAGGGPTAASFPNGARLTYRVVADSRNAPQCAYFASGSWSTNGCSSSLDRDDGENLVTCQCAHMGAAFEASYGVLLNEPKPISQDVLVGNVVVVIGAAALFFVSVARTETRVKDHTVVVSGFCVAVFMANLLWIVNLVLVSQDATDDSTLTAIGMLLHFFVLGLIGSIIATMDFLFRAIPAGSDTEARTRFMAAGLPGGWIFAVVVVILYILVALETDGPTLYDDMLSNGRIAFLHTDAGLYAGFVIEAAVGFLLTVYMVVMMQWEPAEAAADTDTAPIKYAQAKKTLIFAAMWTWVPLVVSVATALSDSDAGQYLLLVVLVIHGLIFFWMALSEMTSSDETYSTKAVDTTANPVFGGRGIGTPGAMTPSLEQSFVSNVSAMDQSFASGGMGSPLPVNMPGAVYSDPGGGSGGGYIDLAGNPDPAEFDDLIFKLRNGGTAGNGGGNTSSM